MECGFWFWFVRPFAETLGALALIFAILSPLMISWVVIEVRSRRNKRAKGARSAVEG